MARVLILMPTGASPEVRWRPISMYGTLVACGAGDGNRTRTVSLGIRYGPTIYAPVAGSDGAVSDLS